MSNKELFEKLYKDYWLYAFRYYLKNTSDEEASLDLVNDLFLKVWVVMERRHIENLVTYMKCCLRSVLVDHYRYNGRRIGKSLDKIMADEESPFQPEAVETSGEILERRSGIVLEAIEKSQTLNDIEKELLALRVTGGLNPRDVAKLYLENHTRMARSVPNANNVSVAITRGTRKLMQEFEFAE